MKADHDHRDRLYLTINLLFLGMLLNPKALKGLGCVSPHPGVCGSIRFAKCQVSWGVRQDMAPDSLLSL